MIMNVLFFIIEIYKASKFKNDGPRIATGKYYPPVPNKVSWKNVRKFPYAGCSELIWKGEKK